MSVFVDLNKCLPAKPSQQLYTEGLDTCIGVIAYGLPGPQGYNKVMVHSSTLQLDAKLAEFFSKVQSSGIALTGFTISHPNPSIQNSTPTAELIKDLEDVGYRRSQITEELIQQTKRANYKQLDDANRHVIQYCYSIGGSLPIRVYIRSNSDRKKGWPYGSLVGTASPGGRVTACNTEKDKIPDGPVSSAAGKASHPSSGHGGSGGAGYGSSSGNYGGSGGGYGGSGGPYASGSGGGHHGDPYYQDAGSYGGTSYSRGTKAHGDASRSRHAVSDTRASSSSSRHTARDPRTSSKESRPKESRHASSGRSSSSRNTTSEPRTSSSKTKRTARHV